MIISSFPNIPKKNTDNLKVIIKTIRSKDLTNSYLPGTIAGRSASPSVHHIAPRDPQKARGSGVSASSWRRPGSSMEATGDAHGTNLPYEAIPPGRPFAQWRTIQQQPQGMDDTDLHRSSWPPSPASSVGRHSVGARAAAVCIHDGQKNELQTNEDLADPETNRARDRIDAEELMLNGMAPSPKAPQEP